MNNKIVALIVITVIVIVGLNVFKAAVAKAESVSSTVSHGSIEALISSSK